MIDLAEGTREVIEVSPEGAPEIIEVSSSRAGRAATVAIGVITTGAPGTSASVTNSGTAGEAVLDFTIPIGENVELRINGGYIQWKTTEAETWNNLIEIANITATIDIGTVTTGDPNTDVLVTNSGAGKDAVFNFTIPRGDSVELRIDGGYIQWKTTTATTWNNLHAVSAITPTITVGTVTTGNAGTNVAVTNSGIGKDGIFNFTIPRGDDVQLRIDSGYIQWKNTTASTWTNIVQITDITATIEVGTVTTGAAGTSVTFVNAGSGKDAIFNLSIPKGTTFTPSVSAEGVISFTNDGGLANPSSVDITGPQGIQGEIGPQGPQGVGVPTINTGDAGKFLKVNTTETDTEWTALNLDSAPKLTTARTISLGGDVSGSASFDGSQDITITANVDEFKVLNVTPTYVDATTFSVPDDLTGIFTAGRILKITDGAEVKYLSVVSSAFDTVTNVVIDGTITASISAVDYSLAQYGLPNASETVKGVDWRRSPVGAIVTIPTDDVPTHCLECNGAEISRSTYAELFAVIGAVYGAGDGSTTFKIPDLRGEFIRGWDNARGIDASRAIGSAQADAFEAHRHATEARYPGDLGSSGYIPFSSGSGTFSVISSDYVGDTETRPRNVAMMFCIVYE